MILQVFSLRLLQTLHHRSSLSTRIDYEDSDPDDDDDDDDERMSLTLSNDHQRLSSSTGLCSTVKTMQISDHLHQSSPCLFPSELLS